MIAPRPEGPRRSREEGSVLFLALMVTLILSGLLVLALERTAVEVAMVGNERFGLVGYYVADTGMTATMAKAATGPTTFLVLAEAAGYSVGEDELGLQTFGDPSADPAYDGTFGRESGVVGTVTYTTALSNMVGTYRVPNSPSGELLYQRFNWTTTGQYGLGDEGAGAGAVDESYRLSIQRLQAIGYLGPVLHGKKLVEQ